MTRFVLNIMLLAMLVIGVGIGLAAYMSYSEVRSSYLETLQSRLQLVGSDVAKATQAGNSLGIAVSEQQTLRDLLTRKLGENPLLVDLQVRAPAGAVLFSAKASTDAAGQAATVSFPVTNDIGDPIAYVDVLYDRHSVDEALSAFLHRILLATTVAFPLALAAFYAAVLFLLKPIGRFVAEPEAAILANDAVVDVERVLAPLQSRFASTGVARS